MMEIVSGPVPSYYRYWGKAKRPEDEKGNNCHLLPYHCLDVAACGYWLVRGNHFHAHELMISLGWEIEEGAKVFAWLLAMHDIGKFAHGFQQLAPGALMLPRLANKYYDARSARHDALGFWLWNARLRSLCREGSWSLLSETIDNAAIGSLDLLFSIVTGHHGRPPSGRAVGDNAFANEDVVAAQTWISALAPLFGLNQLPVNLVDKQWRNSQLKPLSWRLAGLAVLADWLGSDRQHFSYHSEVFALADYWKQTRQVAEVVVATIPANATRTTVFSHIGALFPEIKIPTPLQALVAELPLGDGPELFILEDVTGAGKTEAALTLAQRLMGQGKADGLYVGLPTMATANAMFQRLQKAYRALFAESERPSLMLAHGASQLNPDFRHSLGLDVGSDEAADYGAGDASVGSECDLWFADSRKKALLVDVGVGTLDQALMAILPFRHQSLRMLGLAGKLLLLDEVHAYDAYMNKLLEALLTYHASRGGSVIVLSATLSCAQRNSLLTAFAKGRGELMPKLGSEAYPLVSHYVDGELVELRSDTRPEVRRKVEVAWLHDEADCLTTVLAAAKTGRCVAWIRNTVDDAIRAYRALAETLDEEDLLLFHSRFAFVDRLAVESIALTRFGKDSTAEMRHGKVIIATQVIEQSLDLDLDLMLSDLAPVDLLVQRAGRLQRHVRDASGNRADQEGREPPCLYVHAPRWQEAPEENWLAGEFRGTGYVYDDHGGLWLTQSILRRLGAIQVPEKSRELIESVYGAEREVPANLLKSSLKVEGERFGQRAQADQLQLDPAKGYTCGSSDRWQEEITPSTRLSDPNVTLYLARQLKDEVLPYADGLFAWEMSRLTLSESLWRRCRTAVPHLTGEALTAQLKQHRLGMAEIVLLPQGKGDFYSRCFGFQLQGEPR